jgi:hypothetical protein
MMKINHLCVILVSVILQDVILQNGIPLCVILLYDIPHCVILKTAIMLNA